MRNYLTLLILLVATTTLSGQTATEIIAQHRKATGADYRKDIQSMYMSVSVENPTGGAVPMNMYIERPDKVSIKVEYMGQKMIMVQNGSEFWMINPMLGADPVPIPENQKGQLTQALDDMDGQYADYLEHPENYQYMGIVRLNGIDHHKVKIVNHPSAGEAVVFFDTNTLYAVRQEFVVQGQTTVSEMTDYRVVSGLHIPFLISTYMGDAVVNKMVIKEVNINLPINQSVFAKP